jgi:hypothetical protein
MGISNTGTFNRSIQFYTGTLLRIVLKLREESRIKFIKGRNQALGKVELLEERRGN